MLKSLNNLQFWQIAQPSLSIYHSSIKCIHIHTLTEFALSYSDMLEARRSRLTFTSLPLCKPRFNFARKAYIRLNSKYRNKVQEAVVSLADAAGGHQALARAACSCAPGACVWVPGFVGYWSNAAGRISRPDRIGEKTECRKRASISCPVWRTVGEHGCAHVVPCLAAMEPPRTVVCALRHPTNGHARRVFTVRTCAGAGKLNGGRLICRRRWTTLA